MIDHFKLRTEMHRELVKKNLEKFNSYQGISLSELKERAQLHDLSKYYDDEIQGQIWLNWNYHCKKNNIPFKLILEIESTITSALIIHSHRNRHHPEAHSDVNEMTLLDIIEMISDWTAIAQENGRSSCHKWATENLEKKWNFSSEKRDLIFEIIKEMDHRNKNET